MKIIINLLALLFIPVFLFAGYSYAKSNNDLLSPEPDSWPFLVEEVLPTGEVIVHSGSSTEIDLRTISVDLDVNPFPEDRLTSFPELGFEMGGKITLHRASSYTVVDGKKSTLYRSWTTTVGELLLEKNVALGDEDKINFSEDENLTLGMSIKIIRVARTNVHEYEDIDFDVVEKDDPNLDQGKTRVERAGERGEKKFTYEVIREDGEQISKTLVSTEIVSEPVDKILIVGIKPVITGWCKFNDIVLKASAKYDADPNMICYLMKVESMGNPNSNGGPHKGLFQYSESLWDLVSPKAGYAGASIWDASSQIHVTAWALTHGYKDRWPPLKRY